MKRVLITSMVLIALCFGLSSVARADSATLQINGGAGDPNQVFGGSFNVLQNQGGAGTITDLILLLSVPTGDAAPSGLTSSAGTVGSISLVGNLATSREFPARTSPTIWSTLMLRSFSSMVSRPLRTTFTK